VCQYVLSLQAARNQTRRSDWPCKCLVYARCMQPLSVARAAGSLLPRYVPRAGVDFTRFTAGTVLLGTTTRIRVKGSSSCKIECHTCSGSSNTLLHN